MAGASGGRVRVLCPICTGTSSVLWESRAIVNIGLINRSIGGHRGYGWPFSPRP